MLSEVYKGRASALEIDGDRLTAIYEDGRVALKRRSSARLAEQLGTPRETVTRLLADLLVLSPVDRVAKGRQAGDDQRGQNFGAQRHHSHQCQPGPAQRDGCKNTHHPSGQQGDAVGRMIQECTQV